jgi:hypothetical protein
MLKSDLSQSEGMQSESSQFYSSQLCSSQSCSSQSYLLQTMPPKSVSAKFSSAKFRPSRFWFALRMRHVGVASLCLLAASLALPSFAAGQGSFTLQAGALSPDAVVPGGTSSSNITVGTLNGFNQTVSMSCQVTSTTQTTIDPPSCSVSPETVTPPANVSATITTKDDTTTVSYSVTMTGTAPSILQTTTTPPESLTVLAVSPGFTVTVEKTIEPTSVPAGSGGEGTITINPIYGYVSPTGGVTLSCSTITQLVTIPPVCSFNPQNVQVNGVAVSSKITINSFGNTVTGAAAAPDHLHPRIFYALWLPLPMLALAGLGAAAGGKRSRKAWGLLALLVMSGALFLMPACGNATATTSAPNGITPANTYVFTVTGVDSNGVTASNTGSTTNQNPTVSLTVTNPTN